MSDFENWFVDQDFYTNMRFIHGDNLFSKDGDVYRVLPVQMANVAWSENKSKIEQLEKEKRQALQKLKEFSRLVAEDLICDQVVADLIGSKLQRIEKALRGES